MTDRGSLLSSAHQTTEAPVSRSASPGPIRQPPTCAEERIHGHPVRAGQSNVVSP